jgi:N-acetylglucosamine-6-phosphate deacetylase
MTGATDLTVLRGRLVGPSGVLRDAVLAVDGDRISWVGAAADWPAWSGEERSGTWPVPEHIPGTLLPGLVDVHNHGAAGHGFPDGDLPGARTAARHHLQHGTTSLLASLVTAPEEDLLRALDSCAALAEEGKVAGIHLEGPFLSPERCGAQDPDALRLPDSRLLDRLLQAGRGHVRTITYAPELPGAADLATQALNAGVVPSVGHTTCDAATARVALEQARTSGLGRSSVTHLFNGMPPLHHRSPGPVAASLAAAARGGTVVELIADGVHLAHETVASVFDLVGPEQIALVTDAMAAAGMSDGRYRLGRLDVEVSGGVARLATEGPARSRSIAGGTTRLVEVVRSVVQHAGVDLRDAVTAATATPARLLGIDAVVGSLTPGLRADVLVVDDDLSPVRVMKSGSWVTPQDGQ